MSQINKNTYVHRIGAVSSLSGVPVPTLRVWEARYGALNPCKSAGSQRLYNDEDVLRASLLRQLTANGHAISTVANLGAGELGALLHRQRQSKDRNGLMEQEPRSVSVAVVGLALAARLQKSQFLLGIPGVGLQITETLVDLDSAHARERHSHPDILMVRVNSLHLATHAALRNLIDQLGIAKVIVLYSYGQERVVEAMKIAGMIVRREPITDTDLAELINAVLLIDPRKTTGLAAPGVMIPPRKYSDQTLMQIAGISTNVLCECPRHVAELIAQLVNFEQYSKECLNNSQEDAHLHAQLSAISGSARAMFERALEMVAEHEGITLQPQSADPSH
ncbi:MAG: MerR family transcriptional regulator [Betaproteobacteria bacterium]